MKKVLLGLFTILLATFGFGGISMAIIVDYYPSVGASTICEHDTSRDFYQNITLYSYNAGFHTHCATADPEGVLAGYQIYSEGCDGGWTYKLGSNARTGGTEGQSFNAAYPNALQIQNNKSSCVIKAYAILNTGITNINITGITDPVLGETATVDGISIEPTEGIELNTTTNWGPHWRAYANDDGNKDCPLSGNNSYSRCSPTFTKEDAHPEKYYYLRLAYTPKAGYSMADNYTVTFNGSGSLLESDYDTSNNFYYIKIKYPVSSIQEQASTPTTSNDTINIISPITSVPQDFLPELTLDNLGAIGDKVSSDFSGGTTRYWYMRTINDNEWNQIGSNDSKDVIVDGTTHYGLSLYVNLNDSISDNPTILFNGINWTNSGHTEWENVYFHRVIIDLGAATASTPAPTTYTITWKNGDTILKTGAVAEGATPVYDGDTPTKAEDSSCTYTFDKWTPDLAPATGNTTYTAIFTCTAKQSSSSPSTSSGGKTVKKNKIDVQTDKDTEKEDTKNNDKEDNNEKDNSDTPIYEQGDQSEVLDNGYTREFNNAYRFGLKYGITTMDDINKADMHGPLTRIAMDKMLVNYAINVLHMVPDITREVPNFPDIDEKLNEEYGNAVTLGYQLGIMGINITEFRPFDEVPRADFGTSLGRMLFGLEDGEGLYYEPHLKKLKEKGIITNDDPNLQELRGYVMLMLMRSAMKK